MKKLLLVLLAFAVLPLLGRAALLPLDAFDYVAGLLAPDHFPGDERWFRAGLVLGGGVAVYALLHAAVRERASPRRALGHAGAALGCGLVLAVAGGLSAPTHPDELRRLRDELVRREAEREARQVQWRTESERADQERRDEHEHIVTRRMEATARAAARGDKAQMDIELGALQRVVGAWPARYSSMRGSEAMSAWLTFERQRLRPRSSSTPEALHAEILEQGRLLRAAVEELPTLVVQRYELGVWGYLIHAYPPHLRPRRADAPAGAPDEEAAESSRALLESARMDFARTIAYGSKEGAPWNGWGLTWVGDDDELALGGLVLAHLQYDRSDASPLDRLQSVRLEALGQGRTGATNRILAARAKRIAAAMQGREVDEDAHALAEEPLPAPEPLSYEAGRRVEQAPEPAIAPQGRVEIDFAAAGVRPAARRLPGFPLQGLGQQAELQLVLDVGGDGKVHAAFVERSSGRAYFDAAARRAAMEWRFAPARDDSGRRVRVPVRFVAPEATGSP